ncbi:hypothetical protein PH210_23710 [Paenibacillus sp. BSR1-1]|uniref:hypothetical protein n=1 Tax=Paenibacillus sp. BSR1-1 TaxID=3020845 RepID=UPI0025B218A4|nr:hypothetical protein [Paenibacillus sp. BSR1-1]MDN3019184.1 hypothetical protein [Paenibacillus sp. BSR1-1]
MKKIVVISDFIEGQPVVASVRFSEVMRYINKSYCLYIINDMKYGGQISEFANMNLKYYSTETKLSNQIGDKQNKKGKIEKFLRNPFVLKVWRNIKYSNTLFKRKNKKLFQELTTLFSEEKIECVLVTIPDIYGLYILNFIKKHYPSIPIVIEIRDIINHSIGKGNPRFIYRKAEKLICKYADGIIALSNGIADYYSKLIRKEMNIKLIKNGYNHENFIDCKYNNNLACKKALTLAHVGSIYKGRNIGDFIKGLVLFAEETGINIVFNIVGVLDNQAYDEIDQIQKSKNIKVNVIGTLPHSQAIQVLKECDISVIVTHKSGSDFAIPGKTFEYIGASKPIIAVTEDNELISLVNKKYGECASHNPMDICRKLKAILETKYDFSDKLKYSRRNQAEEIIRFIESTINVKVKEEWH